MEVLWKREVEDESWRCRDGCHVVLRYGQSTGPKVGQTRLEEWRCEGRCYEAWLLYVPGGGGMMASYNN